MRPYEELTTRGRSRRLRRLVVDTLIRDWGFDAPRVRLLAAHSFNTVFRADVDGERFVVRVGGSHRIHHPGTELVEAAWLRHLDATTELHVALPVESRHGRIVESGVADGVPGARPVSVFTFVEGVQLRDAGPDPHALASAGEVLAALHEAEMRRPAAVEVPHELRADRALFFRGSAPIDPDETRHGSLFVEAVARVDEAMTRWWAEPPHPPHLLHGDFGPHNLLRRRGHLRPIDFQDLRYGFVHTEIGIVHTDLARRPGALEPFRAGYEAVRPWPELAPDESAMFAAARRLDLAHLGHRVGSGGLAAAFDGFAAELRAWMDGA